MTKTYRNDSAYVKKRDALFRQGRKNGIGCHICGKPIDYNLDWKHPMSKTADHINPIANGGKMTGELRLAHRSCNSRRGTKPLNTITQVPSPKTSRKW
ncbi:HNH endonuclease [Paramicrobacterium chengjingii]|uniref:HNH endonuclease n=1 Tax=Paramicrobacterium chengjingii TaxID=2769067 RepID=A0ABX6YL53_9MICO|nr:HNH endonuclease [Microbacterium chengjingii]QPZ39533.1 HNH endonuclease [Microbacterium chengjingii]